MCFSILDIAGITDPKQLKADYEHLRYIIQNDHCYTPYTYADSLTDNKSNDASNAGKNVTKPKLKLSMTMTPTSTTKKVGRNSGQSSKSTPSNGLDTSNSMRTDDANSSNENTADPNESDDDEAESETDFSDQSVSESDNDRDSDLDFSVNDCHSRRSAKKIKKRKIQAKKLANKKRRQSTIDFTGSDDNQTPKGKKATKLPKKSLNTSAKSAGNTPTTAAATAAASPTVSSTTSKSPAINTSSTSRLTKVTYVKEIPTSSQPTTSHDNLPSKSSAIQKINSTTNSQATPTSLVESRPQKVVILQKQKVKKESTENTGMSSLFKPDMVIKPKFKAENSIVVNKTPIILNKSLAVSTPTSKIDLTPKPMKPIVVVQSMGTPIVPRFVTTTKLIKAPSVTFRKIKPTINLASEQDKQLDLIDSLLQEKLSKSEPSEASSLSNASQSTIPEDIPNIVKMLETSEASASIDTADLMQSNNSTSSNSMSMTYTSTQSTHDSQMTLNDEFLDSIVNADVFLTDDMLEDVAKLVDDKNIQEVIDQEIQSSSATSISSHSLTSTMSNPNETATSATPSSKPSDEIKSTVNIMKTPTIPANLSTPISNKKEIKVKRADGSFVTLPPIEAPTTRGAKRRAETTPGSETQPKQKVFTVVVQTDSPIQKNVTNTQTSDTIKVTPIGSASKAKPILARERRASVAVKRASLDSKPRRSLSISNPPPVMNTTNDDDEEEEEEDGSDGSYNSEDDPNR